jgi:hypothetical protein
MASTAAIQPAWTLQSQDTAAVGRLHDGAFLQSLTTNAATQYRVGVIPTVATSGNGTAVDLIVTQAASPNMTVVVDAGNAVVGNSSGRGPYVCTNTANQTLTVATSDPTNPRIDLVYIQVIDTVAGDTGSSTTQVGIVTGTPAASPAVPALPTNGVSLSLAQVRVNATVSSITNSNITDVRKSAGIGRGPRLMLPGDALADAGFCYGEIRQRRLSSYPLSGADQIVSDYWGADSVWHGLMPPYALTGTWQNGTSDITLNTSTYTAVVSTSVADPGFPYMLRVAGQVHTTSASSWTAGSPPLTNTQITIDTVGGTVVSQGQGFGGVTASASGFGTVQPPKSTGSLTGAHTVILSAESVTFLGGGTQTVQYAFFDGNGSATNKYTSLYVEVVPA